MPGTLNKAQLKSGIKALTDTLYSNVANKTPDECREQFATELSDLIDQFVKSGTVNVTVNTTGTATVHTGTGVGNVT